VALQEQKFCSCKAFYFLKKGFIFKKAFLSWLFFIFVGEELGIKMMSEAGQGCLLVVK